MTITEAHHVVNVIRLALGQHSGPAEELRVSFSYLSKRAGKALQVTISLDGHEVDAAIIRHQRGDA